LEHFLPSQRCRVPLSIHRKKIVLRRRAFWDFENFSTFSKNFLLDRRRRSANRVSLATRKSSIDRSFSPVLQLVDFKSTHKSLLERTTPSMRYRSPDFCRVNPPCRFYYFNVGHFPIDRPTTKSTFPSFHVLRHRFKSIAKSPQFRSQSHRTTGQGVHQPNTILFF